MKDRLDRIYQKIRQAAVSCGRDPGSVRLVAVSKTMSAEKVKEGIHAGVTILGENYIQEAKEKYEILAHYPVSWHFIGHLQRNKAKQAVMLFDLIHTVDSLKLARELDKQAAKLNKIQNILIQINIGDEPSKSGIRADEAEDLIKEIGWLNNVSVKGLMVIPPFSDDPEQIRPYFSKCRILQETIQKKQIPNIFLNELSMGMTGDFEVAVQEGATLVRIGTAIFGKRQ